MSASCIQTEASVVKDNETIVLCELLHALEISRHSSEHVSMRQEQRLLRLVSIDRRSNLERRTVHLDRRVASLELVHVQPTQLEHLSLIVLDSSPKILF